MSTLNKHDQPLMIYHPSVFHFLVGCWSSVRVLLSFLGTNRREKSNRMWTLVVLFILGLNICQAAGEENSTQMYYFNLTIEEGAIANITAHLKPFVKNDTLNVDNLQITTICERVQADTECRCEPPFVWSDDVCEGCCVGGLCTFNDSSAHTCVSSQRVLFNGSITLTGPEHYDCLKRKESEEFKECNNNLLRKMTTVYSTLTGFDTFAINKYRVGSISADFNMILADGVGQKDLIDKTTVLSKRLSATLVLETRGVVNISMPSNPVCNNIKPTITCTPQEDLNTDPVWQLKRQDKVDVIFTGTESTVTSEPMKTSVTIEELSELWKGEYTCFYRQMSDVYNITHKASGHMDIALLPAVDIYTVPEFPRCTTGSGALSVRVRCEIGSSTEDYKVEWSAQHVFAGPFEVAPHEADVIIRCIKPSSAPQVTCTFKNRCDNERHASIDVNVIYENDQFCAAEGDWKDTKPGFTATLKCTNEKGKRYRKCTSGSEEATWEPELSACVDREVEDLLKSAHIVDIGLGSLNGNAAGVLSVLQNITYNAKMINTFGNMNASVEVLQTLNQKIKNINNQSAMNAFLESSSNMLNKSLNNSWTTKSDIGNRSLAERYLESVEQLIGKINIMYAPKKENVEVATCNFTGGSRCGNTVFNVTVVVDGPDPGVVKTAGFKELGNYLPRKNMMYEPNSIVVSTTTERQQTDPFEVKITFQLFKPRPRNTNIMCVAWDNDTRDWSSVGCVWKGASNEGLCTCTHLSSFAILMQRHPVEIAGLTQVTYIGLSVSILSLVINLVIAMTVWSAVVKTNTLYLRHTAHVNISLCLLVADCCFLASSEPRAISEMWCKVFVVLKHFCYLAMFFWMLCLSSMLLHQTVYLFHNMSKKMYLRLSLLVGYACPLLIVAITFLTYKGGAEGTYYSQETCWLRYTRPLEGSIHTFIIPIGMIALFNVFSMTVVILKLLNNPMITEKLTEKEKKAAITVMRSVILLTPIFGVTWILGFAVLLLDLTNGIVAYLANYAFTLLNAFQGLFILLTTCLGDHLTREALLNLRKKKAPATTTESSTKLETVWKK